MSLTLNMVGGGGKGARLPKEYQEVEYLQSSGGQGFKTGVIFEPSLEIRVDFMWTYLSLAEGSSGFDKDIIGAEGGTNAFAIILNNYDSNHAHQYNRFVVKGTTSFSSQTYTTDTKYSAIIETSSVSGGVHAFINSAQWNWTANLSTSNYPLSLFCRNISGTLSCFSNARIYLCEIKKNGALIRNFIPCYRKSDSVAGMYDLANDVFYTNEGTGTFAVGSDITYD